MSEISSYQQPERPGTHTEACCRAAHQCARKWKQRRDFAHQRILIPLICILGLYSWAHCCTSCTFHVSSSLSLCVTQRKDNRYVFPLYRCDFTSCVWLKRLQTTPVSVWDSISNLLNSFTSHNEPPSSDYIRFTWLPAWVCVCVCATCYSSILCMSLQTYETLSLLFRLRHQKTNL